MMYKIVRQLESNEVADPLADVPEYEKITEAVQHLIRVKYACQNLGLKTKVGPHSVSAVDGDITWSWVILEVPDVDDL